MVCSGWGAWRLRGSQPPSPFGRLCESVQLYRLLHSCKSEGAPVRVPLRWLSWRKVTAPWVAAIAAICPSAKPGRNPGASRRARCSPCKSAAALS